MKKVINIIRLVLFLGAYIYFGYLTIGIIKAQGWYAGSTFIMLLLFGNLLVDMFKWFLSQTKD